MDIEINNGIVLTLGEIPSGEWFKLVGDIAKSGNECYMAIASFSGEGNGRAGSDLCLIEVEEYVLDSKGVYMANVTNDSNTLGRIPTGSRFRFQKDGEVYTVTDRCVDIHRYFLSDDGTEHLGFFNRGVEIVKGKGKKNGTSRK